MNHYPDSATESPIISPLYANSRIHIGFLPEAEKLNFEILEGYRQLREKDLLRRSHFFGGRYENLYFERERIPAIGRVIAHAELHARYILQRPDAPIRCGFWVNEMGPGQVTTEHHHDDNDELLSGVYYVQVPQNSGELIIRENHIRTVITPLAGMFVFFAPTVLHAVGVNASQQIRLSMGMNFGPAVQN